MQREGRIMGVGRDRYSDRHPGGDATHLVTGGSMRNRYGTGMATKVAMAGAALAAAVVSVGGLAGSPGAAAATTAPGVTSNSITVGTISTQTGPISSNFSPLIYGEEGYFKYINAQGGINGRQINLKYTLDDGGNPSQFTQLANTLINQDHVFAVTGVATAFFTPNIFVEAKTPTYGYNVTENWNGPPNLFAAGGSVIYTPAEAPGAAFVARSAKASKVAIVAYGIASSAAACQAAGTGLQASGIPVVYTDYKIAYPGTTVATDVQRMQQAGANFVLTCMDVQGNVTMARAIQQYNLKASQLWLNGNDQSTLDQNQSLMQNIYFYVAHVPFSAPQSAYPGLKTYLTEMNKYEPKYALDEVAMQGWESASLFAAGVKAAGSNLTQANVIAQTNKLTAFTAGGLTVPTNWTTAHTGHAPPYCGAYIQVKGDKYVPALNTGKSVFNCFDSINPKKGPVFPLPPGTPNAS
jgi:ABC-type branched-subunit amino acid transport system substrate-binding protein